MHGLKSLLNDLSRRGIKLSHEGESLVCYAPRGFLTEELKGAIRMHKARILESLPPNSARPEPTGSAAAGAVREFPLSFAQKDLHRAQKSDSLQNPLMTISLRMRAVRVDALQRAWGRLPQRYPILTARVVENTAGPYQHLDGRCVTDLEVATLDAVDDGSIRARLQTKRAEPFDLARGPLLKAELVIGRGDEAVLLILLHKLLGDSASAEILVERLLALYDQELRGEPPLQEQETHTGYHDFVQWETTMIGSPEGEAHARFWRNHLTGAIGATDSQAALPRRHTDGGASIASASLAEETARGLRAVAESDSRSLPVLFLAAFQLLLHKCTGEKCVAVLVPMDIRPDLRFADEIGPFSRLVPVLTRLEGASTLREVMLSAECAVEESRLHAIYPVELAFAEGRDHCRPPAPRVLYSYRAAAGTLGAAAVEDVHGGSDRELELTLEVSDIDGRYCVRLQADPSSYPDEWTATMLDEYLSILREMGREPLTRATERSLAPAAIESAVDIKLEIAN